MTRSRAKLGRIADRVLLHDRDIANRIDDSVVRVMAGRPRLIRRARGYAPAPMALPRGFEDAPEILAFGGELKSTFCLVEGRPGDPVAASGRSRGRGDLRRLPEEPRALSRSLQPPPARLRGRHASRISLDQARQGACARAGAARGAASPRPHRELHGGERLAHRRAAGARRRARRPGLRRGRHDLGRRVPARRLSAASSVSPRSSRWR